MTTHGEYRYPTVNDVLIAYGAIFDCTVQQAADQLRSPDALEGALARPQWYAHYEGADLPHQAAVLAHGIAETQPFVEGNKRTALAVLLGFLDGNRYGVIASQNERMQWIIRLSEGGSIEELAGRIRPSLVPIKK